MALLTTLYRGDTKQIMLVFKDRNNTPYDISGHKIFVGIKATLAGVDPLVVSVTHVAGSGPSDDPVNGKVIVEIPSDQTANLDPDLASPNGVGVYYYEFQRVIAGTPAVVNTLEQGKVQILRDLVTAIV
jgi:hypothetical protein